ncbi:MAG: hypothetical protein FWH32_00025 [Clostridiales bacterium]|nr:hypothetical protein [Clostridiales bacterium]
MGRFRAVLAYWVVALGVFTPSAAYAYIDPATTTYIIQIVTALVVMLGVSLSIFLYKFNMVSAKVKYGLYGIFYRGQNKGGGASAASHDANERTYVLPECGLAGTSTPPSDEDMAALGEPADMERMPPDPSGVALGKRVYRGRLKAALPVVLAVCLSFVFIGCLDLFTQNSTLMPFKLFEVTPVLLACFAACFVILIVAVPLFRGKVFEILLSLALAVLIAGYVQGNFLNMGLGELTGDPIAWGDYLGMTIGSAVFWVCVFAAVFLLWRYAQPVWRGLMVFAPVILIIIQSVALMSVLGAGIENRDGVYGTVDQSGETLSIAGINELSAGNNTVVFLLDRLDEEIIVEIEGMDSAFFDRLDGFTRFKDNMSYYVSTFPSVTTMLTGHHFYFDGLVGDYFSYAWENAEMMHKMKERDVDIKLYMAKGYTYGSIEDLQGIASNILVPEYDFDERVALVKLLKLSGFRYAPMPAKPLFWLSPTEFADAVIMTAEASPYVTNDFAFYQMLLTERLRLSDAPGTFVFYHLLGPHDPLWMDENIQRVDQSTPARQAMGVFGIIYEYIEQMKALGIYEDATIIITGDHGFMQGDVLERPALTGLFVKPGGVYGTPLGTDETSVNPDHFAATIMAGMFGDAEGFGSTYLEASERDAVIREYIQNLRRYEVTGDGRDFSNWRYIGTLENKSDW